MKLPTPKGELAVENLSVAVPGSNNLLVRNVSFSLETGEVLAIIGPTGSGKSTLARAIVGAWPIAGGAVRIDGNDLRHWDVDQIGSCLGYLPQDVELFEGTVAENIARFGDMDEAKVVAAARAANAHDLIQRLPNGYETVVGEDGVGLSGGQRQRVGFARALYGGPAVIVLDEPNSNLDGDGDVALVRAIEALRMVGRTVVVVSHKTNVLAAANRILVMHEGTLARFGDRDEVLRDLAGSGTRPPVAAAA